MKCFIIINIALCLMYNNLLSMNAEQELSQSLSFVFIYDSNECISCDVAALTSYIKRFEKELPHSRIDIVSNSSRNSDVDFLKKKFPLCNIIKDSERHYSKKYNVKQTLALLIFNGAGMLINKYEELQSNPLNVGSLKNLSKLRDISEFKTIGNFDYNILARGGKFQFDQNGYLYAVDNSNNRIIKIDINKNKILSTIEPNYEVSRFFLHYYDSTLYQSLLDDNRPLAMIRSFNIDSNHNINVLYTVISKILMDTTLRIKSDDTVTEYSKYFYSNDLIVSYQNEQIMRFSIPPENIVLNQIEYYQNKFYALAWYPNSFEYKDIISNNYHNLLISSEALGFDNYSKEISYNEVFKKYNLDTFNTKTIGIYQPIEDRKFIYLNPWNDLFFLYIDGSIIKIDMKSYLKEMYLHNTDYHYSINNMYKDGKYIFVLLQEFDKSKQCNKFIIQRYNLNGEFVNEIVFHNHNEQIYYAFLAMKGDMLIMIYQDINENWHCFDMNSKF